METGTYLDGCRGFTEHEFFMRHNDAQAFALVDKMHDRYSLHVLMKHHCCDYSIVDAKSTKILSDVLDSKVSLEEIAESLKGLDIEENHDTDQVEGDSDDMSI